MYHLLRTMNIEKAMLSTIVLLESKDFINHATRKSMASGDGNIHSIRRIFRSNRGVFTIFNGKKRSFILMAIAPFNVWPLSLPTQSREYIHKNSRNKGADILLNNVCLVIKPNTSHCI